MSSVTMHTTTKNKSFQGQNMISVQPSDYSVDVGAAVCGIVSVTSSALSCMPPDEEPEKAANASDGGHPVIVSLYT